MRAFIIAALALPVVAYFALGVMTYSPTVARLDSACYEKPNAAVHVLLWPVSWGMVAGLPSRC